MKAFHGVAAVLLTAAIMLAASMVVTPAARGQQAGFGSSAGELEVRTIARGLAYPWALAFLPDGKMLVTERPGRMRIGFSSSVVMP